jgi:indolepyruvate ferredoxin oxidoreductase beta subunit
VSALGVLVAGAAGQGAEATADLLCRAALAAGLDARRAITRAVSRSAGSVLCQVRLGPGQLASPFVGEGEADLLLALDRLEALRRIHDVRRDGFAVVADGTVPTPRMRAGLEPEPHAVLERLRAHVPRSVEVGAEAFCRQAGRGDHLGGLLLGVAAALLPVPPPAWEQALREQFDPPAAAAWLHALAIGRAIFQALPDGLRRAPAPQAA